MLSRSVRAARLLIAFAVVLILGARAEAVPLAVTIAGGATGDGLAATAVGFNAANLTVDAAGNVIFADIAQGRLRKVEAATGLIGPFPADGTLQRCGDYLQIDDACLYSASSLAVAPDGDVLVGDYSGRVLRVDASTGASTRIAGLPFAQCPAPTPATASVPALDACLEPISTVAADALGNVFVAEGGSSARIRRIDAATGIITTVAGIDGDEPPCANGALATACSLGLVHRFAVDAVGTLVIAPVHGRRILRVDAATGRITTVVGGAGKCRNRDGGPASRVCTNPVTVAIGNDGVLWVLEGDGRVRRIEARRRPRITTVGRVGVPGGLAVDRAGRPFLLYDDVWSPFDSGRSQIARLDPATGALVPVAGNGSQNWCGDGSPAAAACLDDPRALAVAPDGTIVFTELGGSQRVRRVDPTTAVISTIAGNGTTSSQTMTRCPDGVPATASCFNQLGDVAVDAAGNVLVIDHGDAFEDAPAEPTRLRRIDGATGLISTLMEGTGCGGSVREDVPATQSHCVGHGVATDGAGNVYLNQGTRIRRIDGATSRIRTVAGNGDNSFCGDGGLATRACIIAIEVAIDAAGNVFFIDDGEEWRTKVVWLGQRVRRVDAVSGIITTIAGSGEIGYCGDGGPAVEACLYAQHLAIDRDGAVLVTSNGRIRRVDPRTGIITTIAGDPSVECQSSDGSPAFDACVGAEALDAGGRPVFLDRPWSGFARIRRVTLPCGDGVLAVGEQCDDGNRISGDGCDLDCTATGCGNGVVTAGEGCDDGNLDGTDCCDATCQPRTAVACDDGRACTTSDACTASGRCSGSAVVCDAGPCATSICDPGNGTCVATPFPSHDVLAFYRCDDGDLCTHDHICREGACTAGFPATAPCNDHDPCTVDAPVCDPEIGCVYTRLAEPGALVCQCTHAFASPFCDDEEGIARSVGLAVKRGCTAVEKALAAPAGSPRAVTALKRAARRIADATAKVTQASDAGSLGTGCANDVVDRLTYAVSEARARIIGAP